VFLAPASPEPVTASQDPGRARRRKEQRIQQRAAAAIAGPSSAPDAGLEPAPFATLTSAEADVHLPFDDANPFAAADGMSAGTVHRRVAELGIPEVLHALQDFL
jgi:hypothetical protein